MYEPTPTAAAAAAAAAATPCRSLTTHRHTQAALVCKRWAAAVNSPQLLESLDLTLGADNLRYLYNSQSDADRAACLARGRALLQWLLRHAASAAHQLQLSLTMLRSPSEADRAELYALADGCLAACGSQLRTLRFTVNATVESQPPHDVRPWFLHLRQLHSLELECSYQPLRLLVSLVSLGSLHRLSLSTQRLIVGAGVALPRGLTHLSLDVSSDVEGTFSQVGTTSGWMFPPMAVERFAGCCVPCTNRIAPPSSHPGDCCLASSPIAAQLPQVPYGSLASLRLAGASSPSAVGGMSVLTSMGRLANLELTDCDLPATDSCPPSLECLVGAAHPASL